MSYQLRPYQREAVDALFGHLRASADDTLLVLPTGTGKSLTMAEIMVRMTQNPDVRVLMATHVQELVSQNFQTLVRYNKEVDAGINASALDRRDYNSQAIFCSIQTVYDKAEKFGRVHYLIVDEAHMIPHKDQGMYKTFIKALRFYNPLMVVIGLTATPYRMMGGMLTEGEDPMFKSICFDYNIREAFSDGYLTRVSTKHVDFHYDTDGVATRGGEFVAGKLEQHINVDSKTEAAVSEFVRRAAGRSKWIAFCSGVKHANAVCAELRKQGVSAEVVSGEMDNGLRKRVLRQFKEGMVKCLVNVNVLTTGFDEPGIDLIGMFRPTKSPGLYVQIVGRGTRNVYAPGYDLSTRDGRLAAIKNGPKPNCLVLDFAGNIERFGPIDTIEIKEKRKGSGEAPTKECPECGEVNHASARNCISCDHEFPPPVTKIESKASSARLISDEVEDIEKENWQSVTGWHLSIHEGVTSGKRTLRVQYILEGGYALPSEFIPIESTDWGRQKAVQWWLARGGKNPAPRTLTEAIGRSDELTTPAQVLLVPDGRYFKIDGHRQPPCAELASQELPRVLPIDRGIPIQVTPSAEALRQQGPVRVVRDTPGWQSGLSAALKRRNAA